MRATNIDKIVGAPYPAARALGTLVGRDLTLLVQDQPADDMDLERLRSEVEVVRQQLGLQNTIIIR